jgi:hypothetical protein
MVTITLTVFKVFADTNQCIQTNLRNAIVLADLYPPTVLLFIYFDHYVSGKELLPVQTPY